MFLVLDRALPGGCWETARWLLGCCGWLLGVSLGSCLNVFWVVVGALPGGC